ncbi:MAG TPA: 16S rRNA (cytosine(1402)-N(4))-methyltransferase RsmH [archaeon]|nr:16S rRNA (cytosine(1402)-N(4))-methyltransferase RsmH [archaeon]
MQRNGDFSFHIPVLVNEVINLLNPRAGGLYLDGTVGGGGHARAILEASAPDGRLFALDQDAEAIREASLSLKPFGDRVILRQANFRRAREIFPELSFNGILLDLGVSSYQLDTPQRGFSCDHDGPLDMRMDRGLALNAADLLARLDKNELSRVLHDFGESPYSRKLARELASQRERGPIKTTGQLARIVRRAVPRQSERKTLVLTFQALRILVNDELDSLRQGLEILFQMLAPEGRLTVISYHSLEDRMVKHFFFKLVNPCICPPGLPVCSCGKVPQARLPNRKPVRPSTGEISSNPRCRSARLRAVEKLTSIQS